MFSLSDREMIKKEWKNSRLRTSGQSGQDPYTGGWMALCRNRTCCANLPVSVVHTYTQHTHTLTQAQANIHVNTQKHECISTLLHAYESTRPHTLTQKCLNRLEFVVADGGCQHALSELFQMRGTWGCLPSLWLLSHAHSTLQSWERLSSHISVWNWEPCYSRSKIVQFNNTGASSAFLLSQ